jgi:hypothetical protein
MRRLTLRSGACALIMVIGLGLLAGCAPAAAPTAVPTAVPIPTALLATKAPAATTAPTAAPVPTATKPAAATAAPVTIPTATIAPAAAATTAPAQSSAVSFSKDVLPIFQRSCIKCHGGDSTEEGLVLKTAAQTLKGSNNGTVITPGKAAESLLVKQITSGKMPKRANPLPKAEVDLIAAWVNAGAPNN